MKFLKYSVLTSLALLIVSSLTLSVLYLFLAPQLPSIEGLSDVRLQVPLRIYSSDGSLLGEFGEKRRTPKSLDEIPEIMQQAFLAAEDDRFFEHPGVDYQGILRAVVNLIKTGERGQGGSTITMQLARNFYLSSEKTYTRKLSEIFLALKMEQELSKQRILELYLNKIYLGNRSYGVAAAARVYYGKELNDLSLFQIAMIAGLPKAPSRYNPIINPQRAIERRNYVLGRMHKLGHIDEEVLEMGLQELATAKKYVSRIQVEAPYVNEMVRAEIVKQFGDEAYTGGLNVYTTISDKLQLAANDSLWKGLINYDQRHGYRGAVKHVELEKNPDGSLSPVENFTENDEKQEQISGDDDNPDSDLFFAEDPEEKKVDKLLRVLEGESDYGRLKPALVLTVSDEPEAAAKEAETLAGKNKEKIEASKGHAIVMLKGGDRVVLPWGGMAWASPYISLNNVGKPPRNATEILRPGDVIWAYESEEDVWALGQAPEVQGAFVAIAPNDGAIQGLMGGFNFQRSNFNRATQARRQAGSSFKPVIYSSALSKSFTPASLINDAPVVFEDKALEGTWRPENYSGTFHGPTRLREALYKSRNLVSIRVLRSVGIKHATRFASKFGFDENELPHDLSLALGSCEVSPVQMARAFSVFANGGFLIQPYLIKRIEAADGAILYKADPEVACVSCELAKRGIEPATVSEESSEQEDETLAALPKQAEQTLEPRLAYQMNSILQDVVLRGTGRRAMALGRRDLAGKTGTTNDQKDAWFNGYHPDLVASAWVGFDQLSPLGNKEAGSRAALPIWIDFMKVALAGVPEKQQQRPEGLVTVKINAKTGEVASDRDKTAVFEIFRSENAPVAGQTKPATMLEGAEADNPIPEQLF